jgi:hypothetical protein
MKSSRRFLSNQSKVFAKRRVERKVIAGGLIIVSIVSWAYLGSALTKLSIFNIQTIEIVGANEEIVGKLRAAAYDSLEGQRLKIFPRSNTFLYPKRDIVNSVKAASPRVEKVDISRAGAKSLLIRVLEKTPAAVVCPTLPDFDGLEINPGSEGCYMADKNGLLFRAVKEGEAQNFNLYYVPSLIGEASSTDHSVGLQATSTTEFNYLQNFFDGLRQSGLQIKAILIKENGEYEAYIKNPDGEAGTERGTAVIYFNNIKPLAEQMTNLILFWQHAADHAPKAKKPAYEYIELRHGANIFYRQAE